MVIWLTILFLIYSFNVLMQPPKKEQKTKEQKALAAAGSAKSKGRKKVCLSFDRPDRVEMVQG